MGTGEEGRYKALFQGALWSLTSFLIPFLVDAAIGSIILMGLLGFTWLLGLGRVFNLLAEDEIKAIGKAHFWMNYGVFVATGLSFFVRVMRRLFRGE